MSSRSLVVALFVLVAAGTQFDLLGAEFWCEGVDDENNGEVDEGCDRTCVAPYVADNPVTVGPASVAASSISIVRAGTGLGWVYADGRSATSQVWAVVTATSGAPDRPEVRISDGTHAATDGSIVWRGSSGFAACWVDTRDGNQEVYFRLLDASAVPSPPGAADVNVSSANGASLNPSMSFSGSEFAIAWDDTKGGNRDIYFRRISSAGQSIGNPVRVTSNAALQELPTIAWDGTQYAIAWVDERDGNREIYVRRLDASGNLIGSEVRVTNAVGVSDRPSVKALKAAEFGIAWQDSRAGSDAVWYARWTGPTFAVPGNVGISVGGPARRPSLATTGGENLITWIDGRNGPDDLYARRVGLDGAPLGAELRLSTGMGPTRVAAAWHGRGVGVALIGLDGAVVRPRLALVSCGGSDGDADGANLAQGECNDASALQFPLAPEACDGLDNNCDGTWDETCRGSCRANLPTPAVSANASSITGGVPEIAWDGQGYGIAWQDQELYPGCCLAWAPLFRTLDASGSPASSVVRLADPSLSGENLTVVWNGSEFGIAWEQYNRVDFVARIAFQRVSASGVPVGAPREVTKDPAPGSLGHRHPVLQWRNDQYGLVFTDLRPDGQPRANMFLRLDREGRPLERPRDVSPAPFSEQGAIARDDVGFGLAYLRLVDPYFQRLDRFGGLRGAAVQGRNDAFNQGFPQVAWAPWGYGFTWVEDSGPPEVFGDVFFQKVALDGTPQGPPVKLTPDGSTWNGFPSVLMWIGGEFLFAHLDDVDGKLFVRRLDANGNPLGPAVLVASGAGSDIGDPALAWNGLRPMLAWTDSRIGGPGHANPVTAYLTCCEDVLAPAPIAGATWSDRSTLVWGASTAPRYDRVRGDLGALRGGSGDFTPTVIDCTNDVPTNSTPEAVDPVPGSGFYYLVRGDDVCGAGSYNDPVAVPTWNRDPGINAAPVACP